MKNKYLLFPLLLSLALCSCSAADNDSSTPAATSAPETTASSQNDSSSQQEESASDESSDTFLASLSESELEQIVGHEEEFETAKDFLDSGFIEKYYKGIDFGDDNMIPECDDSVESGSVYAHISNYWVGYTYNGKTYGVCKNVLDPYFSSAKELYEYRCKNDNIPNTVYEYDEENDLVIVNIENADSDFIEKVSSSGKICDVFSWKEGGAAIDEIIDFSKHLKF